MNKRTILGICLSFLLAIGGIFVWQTNTSSATIPPHISERLLFPVYAPASLPKDFVIDPKSYDTQEGVLIFYATDKAGQRIMFSEQAKPQGFDVDAFHRTSLKDTKRVSDAPYTSIIGEAENNLRLLSVVTDSTWIIVTTKEPQVEAHMEDIAKGLKQQ